MSFAVILALAVLGAIALFCGASWRRAEEARRDERLRTETYRRSLESVASIATGARNVRCPTCLANWSSVLAHCESGLVGGDASGAGSAGRDGGGGRA
jgi:hypothetical protein